MADRATVQSAIADVIEIHTARMVLGQFRCAPPCAHPTADRKGHSHHVAGEILNTMQTMYNEGKMG